MPAARAVVTAAGIPPPPPPPAAADVGTLDETAGRGCQSRPGSVRSLVSMVVSTVLHVVALLVMALIVASTDDADTVPLSITSPAEESAVELEPFDDAVADVAELAPPDEPLPEADLPPPADPEVAADVPAPDASLDPVDLSFEPATAVDGDLMAELTAGNRGNPVEPAGPTGFGGEVGRRLARAGARSGAIQVSLAWNNFNDIDLHVVAPSGERIFFGWPRSMCGGHLDVDMNAPGPMTNQAVENVYWPLGSGRHGTYRVYVHHFARHDTVDETPFEVHILVDGRKTSHTGNVRGFAPPILVAEFTRSPSRGEADATDDAEDFRE